MFNAERPSPQVLITFAGALGDGVCFLDAMEKIHTIYTKEKQGSVTFAIKPSVYALYQTMKMEKKYNIIIIDFHKYCVDIKYFLKINKELNTEYDIAITPQKAISAAMVTCNIKSERKMTIDYNIKFHYCIPKNILYRCAYSERFIVKPYSSYIKAVNTLVNSLSINHYSCIIPQIRMNNYAPIKRDTQYAVIAPFSSRYEKEWDIVNYIPTANYLIAKGYVIYVIGDRNEPAIFQRLISGIVEKSKIVNLCGKTTMKEWVELIYYSRICIGADSASIHLAAASNVPSFCIVGRMDYKYMFPYIIDKVSENQYIPVPIFSTEVDCQGCNIRTENYGSGNRQCIRRMKSGKTMECIKMISPNELLKKIVNTKYV